MLALLDFEKSLCGGCGGYLPETTNPDASYDAGLPHRCLRCDALQSKQRDYVDSKNPGALVMWPVKPKN